MDGTANEYIGRVDVRRREDRTRSLVDESGSLSTGECECRHDEAEGNPQIRVGGQGIRIDEMKRIELRRESVEVNRQQAGEAHDGLIGEDEGTVPTTTRRTFCRDEKNNKLGGRSKKKEEEQEETSKTGKPKERRGKGRERKDRRKIKNKTSGSATWTSVTYLERATMGAESDDEAEAERARRRETGSVGVITLNKHGAI